MPSPAHSAYTTGDISPFSLADDDDNDDDDNEDVDDDELEAALWSNVAWSSSVDALVSPRPQQFKRHQRDSQHPGLQRPFAFVKLKSVRRRDVAESRDQESSTLETVANDGVNDVGEEPSEVDEIILDQKATNVDQSASAVGQSVIEARKLTTSTVEFDVEDSEQENFVIGQSVEGKSQIDESSRTNEGGWLCGFVERI